MSFAHPPFTHASDWATTAITMGAAVLTGVALTWATAKLWDNGPSLALCVYAAATLIPLPLVVIRLFKTGAYDDRRRLDSLAATVGVMAWTAVLLPATGFVFYGG